MICLWSDAGSAVPHSVEWGKLANYQFAAAPIRLRHTGKLLKQIRLAVIHRNQCAGSPLWWRTDDVESLRKTTFETVKALQPLRAAAGLEDHFTQTGETTMYDYTERKSTPRCLIAEAIQDLESELGAQGHPALLKLAQADELLARSERALYAEPEQEWPEVVEKRRPVLYDDVGRSHLEAA